MHTSLLFFSNNFLSFDLVESIDDIIIIFISSKFLSTISSTIFSNLSEALFIIIIFFSSKNEPEFK